MCQNELAPMILCRCVWDILGGAAGWWIGRGWGAGSVGGGVWMGLCLVVFSNIYSVFRECFGDGVVVRLFGLSFPCSVCS